MPSQVYIKKKYQYKKKLNVCFIEEIAIGLPMFHTLNGVKKQKQKNKQSAKICGNVKSSWGLFLFHC